MEVTLIYKIKADSQKWLDVWYVHYHKKEDVFTLMLPAVDSVHIDKTFIFKTYDLITDTDSIEYCRVLNKQYSENMCKITFTVRSKGTRFLQDAIANNSYMED